MPVTGLDGGGSSITATTPSVSGSDAVASLVAALQAATSELTAATTGFAPIESSTTAQGLHRNTDSATYGKWFTFGNAANSIGVAGTGTPADGFGALAIYQKFGTNNGSNAPVTKTTQAGYVLANYYGPTSDDSAEAFSTFVGVKDTGTGFAQTKPVTGFESIAQVEGSNTMLTGDSAPLLGVGSRVNVQGTAHVATACGFKVSVNSSGSSFGTIDKYIAFWQPATADNNGGTVTTSYGVYVVDAINSETSLNVGRSAGTAFSVKYGGGTDGSTSVALLGQPTTSLGTLSGTYTLTSTPQALTVNAGATLTAGGGTFILDSSSRTLVTYTSFSGTTVSGATIASGSVSTTNAQVMLDPATPSTTALRVNAQRGQAKNIFEVYDSGSNLRLRVNAAGNLVTQGTSLFAATGAALSTCEMNGSSGYVRPGLSTGPGAKIWSGSGAPNISSAVAGDVYFRTDTPSTSDQRIYVATAANTWSGVV